MPAVTDEGNRSVEAFIVATDTLIYCYMLGFLGNMTCCVTMGLLHFLGNATVPVA
jgi:hypothetical protein